MNIQYAINASTHAAMRLVMLLLVLASTAIHRPAVAAELNLLLNGKAIHLEAAPGSNFNERNWGVGMQYDFDPVNDKWIPFVTASEFRDSFNNTSYYAGGGILHRAVVLSDLRADAGIVGFLMKREDYKDGDLFPGVLPVLSFGTDRIAVNISYVPKVHPKMTELVFFQLKIFLKQF